MLLLQDMPGRNTAGNRDPGRPQKDPKTSGPEKASGRPCGTWDKGRHLQDQTDQEETGDTVQTDQEVQGNDALETYASRGGEPSGTELHGRSAKPRSGSVT